jgi:hypothetical protein
MCDSNCGVRQLLRCADDRLRATGLVNVDMGAGDREQPIRVDAVDGVIARVGIRRLGRVDLWIDAQELSRRRVVVAADWKSYAALM